MTQIRPLLLNRFAAHLVLGQLKFMTSAQVMFDTFEASHEPIFSAPAWALAARFLVQRLEAGRPVDMDRTNTVILVEALEGTPLKSASRVHVAQLLARRLEMYMGRAVVLDTAAAQD